MEGNDVVVVVRKGVIFQHHEKTFGLFIEGDIGFGNVDGVVQGSSTDDFVTLVDT